MCIYQVRVWNTERRVFPNTSSPTVIRKRITAPNTGSRSASHELATTSRDVGVAACTSADGELPTGSRSPLQPRVLEFGTPESAKKRAFRLFQEDSLDIRKSPEAQMNSPSSVLSPPHSLKRRTIRDYFASSSSCEHTKHVHDLALLAHSSTVKNLKNAQYSYRCLKK